MTTLQDKLDNIYQTKLEIKSAIGTDSDVFSEYPAMIRSMSGGGVSYSYLDERLSYYVETSDLESMGYATESYVTNAIAAIPGVDLSSYVTYSYLESKEYITINDVPQVDTSSYVTYSYLESKEYLTEIPNTYATYAAIEAMGYATESYVTNAISNIPSVDTSSYVTYTYLENKNYATESYVTNAISDIPGVDITKDIIPEENATYTLGYEGYYYATTYSYELKMHMQNSIHIVNPITIGVKVYDTDRYKFTSEEFAPFNTNVVNVNLGSNNSRFAYTYTNNLILGNDNIVDLFPTYAYVTDYVDSHSGGSSVVIDENIIPKENNTYTLGDSSHIYSNTYSRGVYLGTGVRIFSEGSASSNDIAISLGGVSYFYLNNNRFAPNGSSNNEKLDLGTADRKWNHIYGKSVNVDTAYIGDTNYLYNTANGGLIVNRNGTNVCTFLGGVNIGISPQVNKGASLGNPQQMWNKIYADNAYISNSTYLPVNTYWYDGSTYHWLGDLFN